MKHIALVLLCCLGLAGCGSATSPSSASIQAVVSSELALEFFNDETPGVGQAALMGGLLTIKQGTTAIAVLPINGWTVPSEVTIPRNVPLALHIDYPAWQSTHLGILPAGTGDLMFTATHADEGWIVLLPANGAAAFIDTSRGIAPPTGWQK